MNRIKRIYSQSKFVIKDEGLKSFLKHGLTKIKRNEFDIIGQTKNFQKPIQRYEELNSYEEWIARTEKNEIELKKIYNNFNFLKKPLISIIIPVYNPDHEILKKTLFSVKNQVYENWQLCIANASSDFSIQEILEEFSKNDSRIKIKQIHNKGIGENSNAAMSFADGEFIALLDHDDALSLNALFEIAKSLDSDNEIDFIYSDSDKISIDDIRHEPFFKPDWSPEMMYSVNYTAHLCAFRKSLLTKIGGFSSVMDGAQDWDLILRISEVGRKIHHIKKILYHWRVSPLSTAASMSAKPYVMSSQVVAVTEHLKRIGHDAYVIHEKNNYIHCKFQGSEEPVSIIIPVNKNKEIEKNIKRIVQNTNYDNFEIILVTKNNETIDFNDSRIKQAYYNFENIADAINFGCLKSVYPIVVFMNDSSYPLEKSWLTELVYFLNIDGIGCIGSKIINKNNIIQHAGIIFDKNNSYFVLNGMENNDKMWTNYGSFNWYRNFHAISFNGMIIRKNIFAKYGMFPNKKNFDKIFCLNLHNKKLRILLTPFSILVDEKDNYKDTSLEQTVYFEDGYYNTNLAFSSVNKYT